MKGIQVQEQVSRERAMVVEAATEVLNPIRATSLRECGLAAAPDVSMDRFAAMVGVQLQVPVSLVSLVDGDQQVFPGMHGLPQPWASTRTGPQERSFCQRVVHTRDPLVLPDTREPAAAEFDTAMPGLRVMAYAGIPLTTVDGQVLGSLCAIDTRPRRWTDAELLTLNDLAAMCSTELRLRLVTHQTKRERDRSRELSTLLNRAYARNQLLLSAAQALAGARNLEQIRHQVSDLVSGDHTPSYVGLVVTEPGGRLRRVADPRRPLGADGGEFECYTTDSPMITAKAVRERRLVVYPDRRTVALDFPPAVSKLYQDLGLHAVACAPLVGAREILGVLVFGWDTPHPIDSAERVVITTIAAYTAQALERVRHVEHRVNVAREMQEAMLTDLPLVPGLDMAARYLPSATEEAVGGDWYDAVWVPQPGAPDGRVLALTVGDITGHDVHASTLMGQVRSMVRQAAWCLPGAGPAAIVESLEAALTGVPVDASGTMVHSHLLPAGDGSGRWLLRYTNAGHPPPVLIGPDGSVRVLERHDMLFGFPDFRTRPRTDHQWVLERGTTVFLHTDGLIERRQVDLDRSAAELYALLGRLAGHPPQYIVDTVVETLLGPGSHEDDSVCLAVRV